MKSTVRIRGRGPVVWAWRFGGMVAVLPFVLAYAYAFGDVGSLLVLIAVVPALTWQILICRPGVVISASDVIISGLIHSENYERTSILCADVERRSAPLDLLAKKVNLVLRQKNGESLICPWIAWQDIRSSFFVVGERPLPSRSQQAVLDRLNASLHDERP